MPHPSEVKYGIVLWKGEGNKSQKLHSHYRVFTPSTHAQEKQLFRSNNFEISTSSSGNILFSGKKMRHFHKEISKIIETFEKKTSIGLKINPPQLKTIPINPGIQCNRG